MTAMVIGSLVECTQNQIQTTTPVANGKTTLANSGLNEITPANEENNTKAGTTVTKITWEHAGDLEVQQSMDRNKGTAGLLGRFSKGYLCVKTRRR